MRNFLITFLAVFSISAYAFATPSLTPSEAEQQIIDNHYALPITGTESKEDLIVWKAGMKLAQNDFKSKYEQKIKVDGICDSVMKKTFDYDNSIIQPVIDDLSGLYTSLNNEKINLIADLGKYKSTIKSEQIMTGVFAGVTVGTVAGTLVAKKSNDILKGSNNDVKLEKCKEKGGYYSHRRMVCDALMAAPTVQVTTPIASNICSDLLKKAQAAWNIRTLPTWDNTDATNTTTVNTFITNVATMSGTDATKVAECIKTPQIDKNTPSVYFMSGKDQFDFKFSNPTVVDPTMPVVVTPNLNKCLPALRIAAPKEFPSNTNESKIKNWAQSKPECKNSYITVVINNGRTMSTITVKDEGNLDVSIKKAAKPNGNNSDSFDEKCNKLKQKINSSVSFTNDCTSTATSFVNGQTQKIFNINYNDFSVKVDNCSDGQRANITVTINNSGKICTGTLMMSHKDMNPATTVPDLDKTCNDNWEKVRSVADTLYSNINLSSPKDGEDKSSQYCISIMGDKCGTFSCASLGVNTFSVNDDYVSCTWYPAPTINPRNNKATFRFNKLNSYASNANTGYASCLASGFKAKVKEVANQQYVIYCVDQNNNDLNKDQCNSIKGKFIDNTCQLN